MPYVKVTNRHRGDDGKPRVPGEVVYVSSTEAARRSRDGQVRAATADEAPKPKRRPARVTARPAVKPSEPVVATKDTSEGK